MCKVPSWRRFPDLKFAAKFHHGQGAMYWWCDRARSVSGRVHIFNSDMLYQLHAVCLPALSDSYNTIPPSAMPITVHCSPNLDSSFKKGQELRARDTVNLSSAYAYLQGSMPMCKKAAQQRDQAETLPCCKYKRSLWSRIMPTRALRLQERPCPCCWPPEPGPRRTRAPS